MAETRLAAPPAPPPARPPPPSPRAWTHLPCSPQGFDEYMNMVLADAKEVSMKKKTEKPLGARSTAARVGRSHRSNCLQPLLPCPRPPALIPLPSRPPFSHRLVWLLASGRILLKGENIVLMREMCVHTSSLLFAFQGRCQC